MAYRVLKLFHDLQDAADTKGGKLYHVYHPGDLYPRKGKKASNERIAELSSSDNKQGQPLIQAVEEPPDAAASEL